MRGFLLAFAASAAAVLALPTTVYAKDKPTPQLQPSLRIGVTGVVPVDCSLSQPVKSVEIEDLANPATNRAIAAKARLPFSVSCNTPITVKLTSKSGGLKFDGTSTPDRDFTSLLGYSANVILPGVRSALSCDSADMIEGGQGCSSNVDAEMTEGEGAVAVTVRPGGGLLQKGVYADRVTITITPTLGSEL